VELRDALRTTGSIRQFSARAVDDHVLYEVLDDARFAPSGGNRQAWRVVVVKDAEQRRAIGATYLDAWHDYVGHLITGVVPFSPLASDEERQSALAQREIAKTHTAPGDFAANLAAVPAMLVVLVDLASLAATDRDLDRYQFAGGASVYPFVWSILLSARERGLSGVMTTVATRNEPRLRETLALPPTVAVAAIVCLGYAERHPTRLRRRAVEEFTTVDAFNGDDFRA
jgi:nitroreductase